MPQLCLIVEFHHPYQLRRPRYPDRGLAVDPFDYAATRQQLEQQARSRIAPLIRLFGRLGAARPGQFRIALALSGVLAEQLALWAPEALDGIRDLVAGNVVELLGTTYHHSLAAFTDADEFAEQVALHRRALRHWFDTSPQVFVNTNAAYWDGLAPILSGLGFSAAVVPDLPDMTDRRSPNQVYRAATVPAFRLLPRNERLPGPLGYALAEGPFAGAGVAAPGAAIANARGTITQLVLDEGSVADAAERGTDSALAALVAACEYHGVALALPRNVIDATPRGTLWYSRPATTAAAADTPEHRRLYATGARIIARGNESLIGQWRLLTMSDLWEAPAADGFQRLATLVDDLEHHSANAPAREDTGIPWPTPTIDPSWRAHDIGAGAFQASA